jgi:thiol-disulfide isomerase/thioredoxin
MPLATLALFLMITPDAPPVGPGSPTPDERFRAMRDAHQAAFDEFVRLNEMAKNPEDEAKVLAHPGRRPGDFAGGFMDLARKHPGTAAAEDSLLWVCTHIIFHQNAEEAKRVLVRDHIRSAKLGPALGFQGHYGDPFEGSEAFFRSVLAASPHREIQGLATYWLARHLSLKADRVRDVQKPDFRRRLPALAPYEVFGQDWDDRLRPLDPEALDREADQLFERVGRFYSDIPHNDKGRGPGTLDEATRAYLHEHRDLAIGKPAPEFEGDDLDGRPFRLANARGRVVVLDFGSHFYCGACRNTYPLMRAMAKRLDGRKFTLISINAEPDKLVADLKDAWKAEGNTWRCLFDGNWEGPIQKAWNIQTFPTIYVLDARGLIRHKLTGGNGLEEAVDKLLAEVETAP